MRGQGVWVTPVMAGCRADIDRLFKMFSECNSLSYSAFAGCFRQINFASIFAGKLSAAELYEFSEKLLQIALSRAMQYRRRETALCTDAPSTSSDAPQFLTKEEIPFQERIFGVYLMYSLFYTQPGGHVAQIRVTPEQMQDLEELITDGILVEKCVDAYAALCKLTYNAAFRVVAFAGEHNPLLHKRFDKMELEEGAPDESEFKDVGFFKALQSEALLTKADVLLKQYMEAKGKLNLPASDAIDVVKDGLLDAYEQTLQQMEKEKEAIAASLDASTSGERHHASGPSGSDIKQKAYRSKVTHPRHRRHWASSSHGRADATGSSTFGDFGSPTKRRRSPSKSSQSKAKRARRHHTHAPSSSPSTSQHTFRELIDDINNASPAQESGNSHKSLSNDAPGSSSSKTQRKSSTVAGSGERGGVPGMIPAKKSKEEIRADRLFEKLKRDQEDV